MSKCYLRSRGSLTKLGEKNLTLIMDTIAEFMGHEESQLSNCAEISSDLVKGNSGRGRSRPPTQETHQLKQRGRLSTRTN